jgi:hypothetical protein
MIAKHDPFSCALQKSQTTWLNGREEFLNLAGSLDTLLTGVD